MAKNKDKIARNMARQVLQQTSDIIQQNNLISSSSTGIGYGIRYTISTDTMVRIGGSIGKVSNIYGAGTNDFDNIMPWAGMRRCNLPDNFAINGIYNPSVNAYYGDVGYIEDGSNGQVMVEVPAFYYKRFMPDSDTIETWISMSALDDYKLHPWFYDKNGKPVKKRFFSAYEGSAYDVTTSATEVNTLTITSACTSSGNVTITLDQYTNFNVAVTSGDTVNQVATKIRNVTYSGWTTSGTDPNVIFTCNTTGMKTTAIFSGGTTGVTATVSKTTTGAGGYVKLDAQAVDFAANTGDKLCSIAGVKPLSGKSQSAHIINFRKIANNRGAGWEQQYFTAVSAIQMLFTVEYAGLNSQSLIGQGVANISDDGNTNCSVLTGTTSSLGNKSGRETGVDGLVSISYRGIENLWGNIWKWVDGFNVNNGISYISNINGNFTSDVFSGQYTSVGFSNASSNGYVSKIGLNNNFDYGFLPTEVLGTSSSRYVDYLWQNSAGAFVALLGGGWNLGANAGVFSWNLINSSGAASRSIGGRLCC